MIFPNKFQQDNFLKAGKEVQFPDRDAPFQFRLKDPGTETVIAICNASGKTADGIQHDFKKRQFTDLGNYRGFLTRPDRHRVPRTRLAEGQKEGRFRKRCRSGATPSEISSRDGHQASGEIAYKLGGEGSKHPSPPPASARS